MNLTPLCHRTYSGALLSLCTFAARIDNEAKFPALMTVDAESDYKSKLTGHYLNKSRNKVCKI